MSTTEALLNILKAMVGLIICALYLIIFIPPSVIMLPLRIAWDDAGEIHDFLSKKIKKMLAWLMH